MESKFFENFNDLLTKAINSIDNNLLVETAEILKGVKNTGKKIIVVGNGGSAAMASHVAVDLTKAAGCRAVTFNEADLLTCFANDYGYENWVEKALKFYADKGDVVILISSSGTSKNIINGANWAKEFGLTVITLSGFNTANPLRKIGDINLWVDSKGYNIIEMAHHIWLVSIVDYIVGNIEYKAN
jgi:D-sedoheptulose 7-phosphate isomerase